MRAGSDAGTELLCMSFNQDNGCFAVGTDDGFRIYNCEPFEETFRRGFREADGGGGGGIGQVEMLFRCNILALVGGGKAPRFPPNKVMIWDDHQSRCIGELSFRTEVRRVCLKRDRIVVVLEHKVYVYNFGDMKLLFHIETIGNPKGLCVLSPGADATVLACPGLHRGQVRVEMYHQKRTKFISAHDSALACLAISMDGTRLATASEKGTLIRVFDTADGQLLQELRRGAGGAQIYCLSFAPQGQWLALSSDKGTVHVFTLQKGATAAAASVPAGSGGRGGPGGGEVWDDERAAAAAGAGPGADCGGGHVVQRSSSSLSAVSVLRGVLPKYFSSEWSLAQFRLPEETRSIVAFGPQRNTVIIVSATGSFYKCVFDPLSGGEMIQQAFTKFLKDETDVMGL